MYSKIHGSSIFGIDSIPIEVEADVSDGLPVFDMVGFLGAEVKEAKERVRTCLKNCGVRMPAKRITINLSPGGVRKNGSGFDMPIAVALLEALGVIPKGMFEDCVISGELSLDGRILAVNGAFSIALGAKKAGYDRCFLPPANIEEGQLIQDIKVISCNTLMEFIGIAVGENNFISGKAAASNEVNELRPKYDFADLNGQRVIRRSCEVAVAGMHNLLMVGPPGSGKSFAANCIPGILPPMTEQEKMEVTQVYSACGIFEKNKHLLSNRPFRAPHHTISAKGLCGGGLVPQPGEISLAHRGVLFLDELAEFSQSTLETLREPLEEKKIKIVRSTGTFVYPADFILVAAMNPCGCGYYPDLNKCNCREASIDRYLGRISQPFLDRIDITVESQRLVYDDISKKVHNESSEDIRKRVVNCVEIQRERYKNEDFDYNSQIPVRKLEIYAALDAKEKKYMQEIYEKLEMSVRAYHKLLRVARTIADLEGAEKISLSHLNEAVCYRSIDKKIWKKR